MKIKKYAMVAVLLTIFLVSGLFAKGVIIGRVIDDDTGEGLPGANIQLLGTVYGASTNIKGAFIIRNVPTGTHRILVSMIGYQNQTVDDVFVTVDDTALVKVNLKETAIEIDPVVVTASRWQQETENTSATVEVLTAKEIMQRNPIRFEEVLDSASSVEVRQETVSIRGSDGYNFGLGNRVLVMIDGIPIMTSDLGKAVFSIISPPDIERVEIVRGAGSALYGSSAMGGVINVITADPLPQGRTYIRTSIGAFDDHHEPDWNWAARADSVLNFNEVHFSHSQQFGNIGLLLSGRRIFSTGHVENLQSERYNFFGKLKYRFPNASALTLSGYYGHDDSDLFVFWRSQKEASRVARNELGKTQDQNGIILSAIYSLPISSKTAIEMRGYLNRSLLGFGTVPGDALSPAFGLGGTIIGNVLPAKSFSLLFGSDFKLDKVESTSEFYGTRDAILSAPFLQMDWRFHPNFNFILGGRYDRYQIYSDPSARFGEGKTFEHFSPKLGLNYKPFSNTTLRANVANGFKFPIVFQLFFGANRDQEIGSFPLVGNPNLQSEESWEYELGIRQKITPSWFFEVNGFYAEVSDLIEPVFVEEDNETIITFTNIPNVRRPGIEFISKGRWWNNKIGLKVSLLYMNPENKDTGELLSYRRKFGTFIASSFQPNENLEFQIDYKYASAQERYDVSNHQLVPQKVLDTRILFYWQNYTFQIGVNNALNYAYTVRDQFLEPNRSVVASFTAEF